MTDVKRIVSGKQDLSGFNGRSMAGSMLTKTQYKEFFLRVGFQWPKHGRVDADSLMVASELAGTAMFQWPKHGRVDADRSTGVCVVYVRPLFQWPKHGRVDADWTHHPPWANLGGFQWPKHGRVDADKPDSPGLANMRMRFQWPKHGRVDADSDLGDWSTLVRIRFNGRSMAGSMLTSAASGTTRSRTAVSMAEAWPGRC